MTLAIQTNTIGYYRKTNKVVARFKREAQPEAVTEHPQPEANPEAMTEHPQPPA